MLAASRDAKGPGRKAVSVGDHFREMLKHLAVISERELGLWPVEEARSKEMLICPPLL